MRLTNGLMRKRRQFSGKVLKRIHNEGIDVQRERVALTPEERRECTAAGWTPEGFEQMLYDTFVTGLQSLKERMTTLEDVRAEMRRRGMKVPE